MQACKIAILQEYNNKTMKFCHNVSMQVLRYASIHVCMGASMQVKSVQECKCAGMQVWN